MSRSKLEGYGLAGRRKGDLNRGTGWGSKWQSCDLGMVVVVQLLNRVPLLGTAWTAALQGPLSLTVSQSLLKLMFIKVVMLANHLIPCHPFSSYPQSSPESGSFLMSRLFALDGQSMGASAATSVLLMNIQD